MLGKNAPTADKILEFSSKFLTPNKMLYYYTQLFWVENHVISRCHVFSRLPSTWRRKSPGKRVSISLGSGAVALDEE